MARGTDEEGRRATGAAVLSAGRVFPDPVRKAAFHKVTRKLLDV